VHSLFRLAVGVATMGFAATLASSALAQDREHDALIGGGARKDRFESPQYFAAEVRFGLFNPAIDSDPSLRGAPYKQVFGTAPRLLVSAEFDWQAIRIPHVGSIGPGIGVGYMSASDPAALSSGAGPSGETTTLQIIPFDLIAVLRVDVLWRAFHIPLVPYAKGGLGYALWRASNTLGTSRVEGVAGTGHSIGSHVALGLALNLNPFDEYAARGFDDALGVNSTYVFGEWTREDLTGLGFQSDPLRVGGTSWTFGLAFEF
jgi:hypothetical protein